jgi:hypothetical protein
MLRSTAGTTTSGKPLRIGPQLASGDRSRTKHGHNYRCKKCVFHSFFAHDRSPFKLQGELVAWGIRGGLAAGNAAFEFGQIGVIQHSGPDALDLALMINKNGLWGEMKAVTNGCMRIHLNKNGHIPKRMK